MNNYFSTAAFSNLAYIRYVKIALLSSAVYTAIPMPTSSDKSLLNLEGPRLRKTVLVGDREDYQALFTIRSGFFVE